MGVRSLSLIHILCIRDRATSEAKVDAAFEFFTKLGVPYWCFHDIDLAPDAEDIGEYEKNLKHMVALAKARQDATGILSLIHI